MIMKLLFIFPESRYKYQSLGISFLTSYLKRKTKATIHFADLNTYTKYSKKQYDIIGMSIHTPSVFNARQILKTLKKQHPKSIFVAGGPHPSALPEQMLNIGFHQVVVGLGQQPLLSIIEGNRSEIIHGNFDEIDELAYPDFSNQNNFKKDFLQSITSLGCPFNCSFCSSSHFWQRKWRPRNLELIIDEMVRHLKKHPTRMIALQDDNFTLKDSHVENFCDLFKRRILSKYPRVRWKAFSRVEKVNDNLCEMLRDAKCSQIYLGIETASQEVLNDSKKKITVEQQADAIHLLRKYRINPYIFILVGLLGENKKTVQKTASFMLKHKVCNPSVSIAKVAIYPKTDLHAIALNQGFDNNEYLKRKSVPLFTYENTEKNLNKWTNVLTQAANGIGRPQKLKLL